MSAPNFRKAQKSTCFSFSLYKMVSFIKRQLNFGGSSSPPLARQLNFGGSSSTAAGRGGGNNGVFFGGSSTGAGGGVRQRVNSAAAAPAYHGCLPSVGKHPTPTLPSTIMMKNWRTILKS